jgi:CheY-like chemotaxis protein
VLPGEYFVHDEDLLIMTTLGSCIAACLWDREKPRRRHEPLHAARRGGGATGRYGSFAMELLINEMIKRGASRATLEAKVFGGGAVISGMNSLNVGERNTKFVLDYLRPSASRGQQGRAGHLPAQGLLPAGQRQGDGQAPGLGQHRSAGGAGTRRGPEGRKNTNAAAARSTCSDTHPTAQGRLHAQDKTRVVVDDSALVRRPAAEIINRSPTWSAWAPPPTRFVAREMIRNLNPDVITLDVEMPRMDGIDFLSR